MVERRACHRYSFDADSWCKILPGGKIVCGKIRDISISGVFVGCNERLDPGTHVEVSISWPFFVHSPSARQLKILGAVVRSDEHGMAISIVRHDFDTYEAIPGRIQRPLEQRSLLR